MIRHRLFANTRRFRLLAALPLLVAACLTPACDQFEEPELDLDNLYSYTAAPLAVMLSAVQVNGRINYPVLQRDYADYLERYIELAAEHGPESEPAVYFQARHRATYYINVHNGLILQAWMRHGAGTGNADLRFDLAWLDERIHRVDGQTVSIRDVAELAMQEAFPLIPLALTTGTVTGPPVPSPPLEAETFERSLDAQVRVFLADERAFQRVPSADGDGFIYYGPPVVGDHLDRLGDTEAFLEKFVPASHPFKLELLRAAHAGTLRFRPHSDRIHLPDATLDPIQ